MQRKVRTGVGAALVIAGAAGLIGYFACLGTYGPRPLDVAIDMTGTGAKSYAFTPDGSGYYTIELRYPSPDLHTFGCLTGATDALAYDRRPCKQGTAFHVQWTLQRASQTVATGDSVRTTDAWRTRDANWKPSVVRSLGEADISGGVAYDLVLQQVRAGEGLERFPRLQVELAPGYLSGRGWMTTVVELASLLLVVAGLSQIWFAFRGR